MNERRYSEDRRKRLWDTLNAVEENAGIPAGLEDSIVKDAPGNNCIMVPTGAGGVGGELYPYDLENCTYHRTAVEDPTNPDLPVIVAQCGQALVNIDVTVPGRITATIQMIATKEEDISACPTCLPGVVLQAAHPAQRVGCVRGSDWALKAPR